MEKAYAKIHGGYKNLTAGSPYHALMDLAGCPTMSLNFKDAKVKEMADEGKLWDMIKHFDEEGYIMTGGTPGEDLFNESENRPTSKDENGKGGLIPGHAYSIIAAKEANGHKLLMMRNPWGDYEWDGDWSDNSPLWTQDIIDIIKPTFDGDDGTFWMCYKDFVDNFDSLDVCRIRNWEEARVRGRFIRFTDSENATVDIVQSKWIYALNVPKKSHVVITLNQEDERIEGVFSRRPYLDVGIAVLKMDQQAGSTFMVKRDYLHERSIELELILEPGQYMVVPRTTGCNLKRPEAADFESIKLMDSQG